MIRQLAYCFLLPVLFACGGGSASSSSAGGGGGSGGNAGGGEPPMVDPLARNSSSSLNAPLAEIEITSDTLIYGFYANQSESNRDHLIPDFSYAGYMGGGVALPIESSIPVRTTLSPVEGDDFSQIQAAIDAVAALAPDERGIKGAVLLSAGVYQVSDQLSIRSSGVVLRGEGQGLTGTVIEATSTREDDDNNPQSDRNILLNIIGSGTGRTPNAADNDATTQITQDYVPVGSRSVEVASVEGYQVGHRVGVKRTPNADWTGENGGGGVNTFQWDWDFNTYHLVHERTVVDIQGNTLWVDIPFVDTIDQQWGGGEVYRLDVSGRLQQVGVENLRLRTLTDSDLSNEDRAFFGIDIRETENSWLRDVTVEYFSHGINFRDGAAFNTAQDVAYLDPDFVISGGRRYGFNMDGGSFNLFQRCYGRNGRHTFVTGSRVSGPNVFLDCVSENAHSDSGPHHRWSTGTLYDNTKGDRLFVQNREASGTGHGWAGAQQMFWNTEHDEYIVQAPPYAMNWAVGSEGDFIAGVFSPNEPDGIIELSGNSVTPRSLYLQQLQDRLGAEVMEGVTTATQREGRIWNQLSDWQGESNFAD